MAAKSPLSPGFSDGFQNLLCSDGGRYSRLLVELCGDVVAKLQTVGIPWAKKKKKKIAFSENESVKINMTMLYLRKSMMITLE